MGIHATLETVYSRYSSRTDTQVIVAISIVFRLVQAKCMPILLYGQLLTPSKQIAAQFPRLCGQPFLLKLDC